MDNPKNCQDTSAIFTQFGPDAWDAEHGCLRPEVLEQIARERERREYQELVEKTRKLNKDAHHG